MGMLMILNRFSVILAALAVVGCGSTAASTGADDTAGQADSSGAADTGGQGDTGAQSDTASSSDAPGDTGSDVAASSDVGVDAVQDVLPDAAEDVQVATDVQVGVDTAVAKVTYAAVQPIYAAKCGGCHTGGGSGAHNIGTSFADGLKDSYYCAGKNKAACTIVRILDGTMPPGAGCSGDPAKDAGKAKCLTKDEQDKIAQWITDGMLEK